MILQSKPTLVQQSLSPEMAYIIARSIRRGEIPRLSATPLGSLLLGA